MHDQSTTDNLWNLPVSEFPHRPTLYWDIVAKAETGSEPLSILEIGVFQAGLLQALLKRSDIEVESYTGVDPYLAHETDSYTGRYWQDENESNSIWKQAKKIFDDSGFELHRTFSHEFYELNPDESWNIIIIDGDHRRPAAHWDLHHWFKRLNPRGIMIGDDYGNSDTPDVTRAVNDFIRTNKNSITRIGHQVVPFQNKGKEIPISLTVVYFEKAQDAVESIPWEYQPKRIRPIRRFFRSLGFDITRVPRRGNQ